jgi:hypothetical protein
MGHPIFRDLIYQQWFSSGKSEGISQEKASAFKDIPLPIIVLVMTAVRIPGQGGGRIIILNSICWSHQVENALMEYRQDGGRTQMNFSLEFMGPRYDNARCPLSTQGMMFSHSYEHHMKCAKEIQLKSPHWLKTYQKEMYRKIL